jgi:hypothetical protein
MAFQNVNVSFKANTVVKATALEIGGEPFIGHLIYLNSRIDKETGQEMSSLGFLSPDGSTRVLMYPAGNIKYMIKDTLSGDKKVLTLGANTRITRKPDEKVKGKNATRYTVEQDLSDVVDLNALPPFVPNAGDEAKFNSLGGGAPVTQAAKKAGSIAANLKKLQEGA